MNSGTKIGAKIAHLGSDAGMIRSRITITRMKPISSQSAPMSAPSSKSAMFTAITVGMLLKLK